MGKSIYYQHLRHNFVVQVTLSLILGTMLGNHLCVSQPLINQLAVLFRARPPWPTTFPAATNSNSNSGASGSDSGSSNVVESLTDMISNQITKTLNKNLQLDDFSHFNDLLTGQTNNANKEVNMNNLNIQNLQNYLGNNDQTNGASLHQLYGPASTPSVLATSHPIPQLEFGNGNSKGLLIAHPVLGPNQMPAHLDHEFNNQNQNNQNYQQNNQNSQNQNQNNFNNNNNNFDTGLNGNGAVNLYLSTNPKPTAVRPSNYIHFQGQEKKQFQNFHNIQLQNYPHRFNLPQKYQFPQIIPLQGKPLAGGKLIAIPIPVASNSPLLKNQFYRPKQSGPQIIAVRQPFPTVSITTSAPPQFIPSEQVTRFTPSQVDFSSNVPTTNLTTSQPVTTIQTNATTTTLTTTTTHPTITTTPSTTTPTPTPIQTTLQPLQNYNYNYNQGSNQLYTNTNTNNLNYQPNSFNQNPTFTTTPTPPKFQNIQDVINSDKLNQIHSSPSTLVGTFRFPDPPTPPNLQSMNTRYELQHQDVLNSHWVPQKPKTKSPYYSPTKTNTKNGFYSSSISSVPLSSSNSNSNTKSKWKYDNLVSSQNLKQTSASFQVQGDSASNRIPKADPSFRPSLQLHSFEDSTTGLREFITVNPNPYPKVRDSKSLFSKSVNVVTKNSQETDLPTMESGFRPFNHFAFVNGVPGASISSTTENSVLNLIRNEFVKDMKTQNQTPWSDPDPTGSTFVAKGARQDRKFFGRGREKSESNSYSKYTNPYYIPPASPSASSSTITPTVAGYTKYNYNNGNTEWVGRFGSKTPKHTTESTLGGSKGHKYQATTASSQSELFEDWLAPRKKKENENIKSSKGFSGASGRYKSPLECEKFHRFGFCPVTAHYPLEQVESIGSRCTTLLSHLIAPLPKTDVRYDVIVPKNFNGSGRDVKDRSGAPSGWSWKTFAGKPVCDTKEVKIVPGWAKNEQGEWLVILQTEKWKQEAQISLCTSTAQSGNTECDRSSSNCDTETMRTKCVQRFTAQRLVVLDPEDEDRCPVVRSVFLPSACVCLNDENSSSTTNYNYNKGRQSSVKKSKTQVQYHSHPQYKNSHGPYQHNSTSSSSSTKKPGYTKVISGRSLSTSFFGFGDMAGLDQDTAADSSSGENKEKVLPTSSSVESDLDSEKPNGNISTADSEELKNVENVGNPSNTTFMVITSSTSSESSSEGESLKEQNQQGSFANGNTTRSSNTLGSSFIVSGGDSTKSNKSNDNNNNSKEEKNSSSSENGTESDSNG